MQKSGKSVFKNESESQTRKRNGCSSDAMKFSNDKVEKKKSTEDRC